MYSLSHFLWKQTKWWRRLRNCKRRVTGWAAHILQATSWVRLFPFVIKSQEKRNSNCFYQLRVPERMTHHPELRQAATASTKACLSQYRVNGDLRAGDHLCLSSQLPFKQCFPSISWLAEHPHLCSNHKFPQDIKSRKGEEIRGLFSPQLASQLLLCPSCQVDTLCHPHQSSPKGLMGRRAQGPQCQSSLWPSPFSLH